MGARTEGVEWRGDAQPAAATKIVVGGVRRTYKRADGSEVHALAEVDLQVREGEFVCVIGPSGCGKTTLLQLIAGLVPPSEGEVLVDGSVVVGPGPERGVVFQRDSVFPWMRVRDNVEYGLKCRGVEKETRRRTALHYLDAVGLGGMERSWPRELSGGELKRVAVGTVFANGASVLLLDEPFGALDYVTKRQLHRLLLNLWEETGTESRRTIVFVTHDVEEALTLADTIVVLREGRLVERVPLALPRPRTTDVLALPEALQIRRVLLGHLGLEDAHGKEGAPPALRGKVRSE